jgi:anti-anti-sigma factor
MFHFLSHSWEVTNVDDGILVTIAHHELDAATIAVLVDDLCELARESGQPNLYVDFDQVRQLASIVFGKLISLDGRLREMGCRLVLCNLDPFLYQTLRATRLTDSLDVRVSGGVPT